MSETRVLVLRTGLFDDRRTAPASASALALGLAPGSLPDGFRVTELAVDGDIGAMSTADWDRVLEAVLDNDRCITL